ncbi:hypothetical protein [uncultured Sphaerochaeta sp.]|uniref:hypothetical protein n=1 Tax=uncultured Sphaerochaeta sp. TaxID=886478 RepID=UPI002AA8991A|nr:hypothetical protein [uncultured Sphaerochaeta sp.]
MNAIGNFSLVLKKDILTGPISVFLIFSIFQLLGGRCITLKGLIRQRGNEW